MSIGRRWVGSGRGANVKTSEVGEIKLSGAIWSETRRTRAKLVLSVCAALSAEYEPDRLGNPWSSLDDLVYLILSNRTSPKAALTAYRRIKRAYATWDDLAIDSGRGLEKAIAPAGLSKIKSRHIRGLIAKVAKDFGLMNLRGLAGHPPDRVLAYLSSLPGVSSKVAKCSMIYTMGFDELPVDTHVFRIASRLGWTSRKRADQCDRELDALVPQGLRARFHVDCILHGRSCCAPANPDCANCVIGEFCESRDSIG